MGETWCCGPGEKRGGPKPIKPKVLKKSTGLLSHHLECDLIPIKKAVLEKTGEGGILEDNAAPLHKR